VIRYTLLSLIIVWLSVLTLRDWYKGVCGLIVLMAFLERPDMLHAILGIPGFNPWNILLVVTVCSWLLQKQKEQLRWDMPRGIGFLLILQFLLFTIGFLRIFFDRAGLEEILSLREYGLNIETGAALWNNYFFNTLKWAIPGLLLFHGCNSRSRLIMAIFSLLAMYLLLSLLVYKAVPPWKIIDVDSLSKYAIKLDKRVGYHRVDLSAMLAGASWSFFSAVILLRKSWQKAGLIISGGMVIFAQGLTGGRAGWIAWCAMGLLLGIFRWRKLLILMPLIVLLLIACIPQIKERLLIGLNASETTITTTIYGDVDIDTLTAGRDGIWRLTLEQFEDAPFIGHGRLAIFRTGVINRAIEELGEPFGHPHSAYIEQLVDNGLIGLIIVLIFYLTITRFSLSLVLDKKNPIYIAVGCIALSSILTQLIAALTAQSFYPRQGVVGMWCAIGIMLRVYVEREKAKQANSQIPIWEKNR